LNGGIKLTCNILCTSIQKATNDFTFINTTSIQSAINCTTKILLCKESDFTLDREAETKIKLLISNNNDKPCEKQDTQRAESMNADSATSANSVQSISNNQNSIPVQSLIIEEQSQENPVTTANSSVSPVPTSPKVSNVFEMITNKKATLRDFAAQIIRPSRYMLGIEMTKAIEVLRSFATPDLYIASAEAANQIASWRLNQNWTSFARIFSSRRLIDNKLNGTYLIPMFSGDTSSGHWFLIVVRKLGRRNMKAWCVDSLGRGSINENVILKIETAFAPGRAKLTWQTCQCRCQEELECGPRTVLAMRIIQQNLVNNAPIEECIRKATLQHAPFHGYTPAMIREKVAYLVNRFMPSMISPPIRIRNRNIVNPSRRSVAANIPKSNQKCIVLVD